MNRFRRGMPVSGRKVRSIENTSGYTHHNRLDPYTIQQPELADPNLAQSAPIPMSNNPTHNARNEESLRYMSDGTQSSVPNTLDSSLPMNGNRLSEGVKLGRPRYIAILAPYSIYTSIVSRLQFISKRLGRRMSVVIVALFMILLFIGGHLSYRWLFSSHATHDSVSSNAADGSLAVTSSNENGANQLTNTPTALSNSNQQTTSSTMNFVPVVPVGESQLADLGSKNYDSAHNSYTFDDLFLAEPLQVSEQPLPTGYASVADAVRQVALVYHAATPINTSSGLAYMNTNSTSGLQTVIFSTQGLLIFAQSSYQHTTTQWATYLESLQ